MCEMNTKCFHLKCCVLTFCNKNKSMFPSLFSSFTSELYINMVGGAVSTHQPLDQWDNVNSCLCLTNLLVKVCFCVASFHGKVHQSAVVGWIPPCWRVMITLEEKKLQGFKHKLLSFEKDEHETKEVLKINPRGQVGVARS